MSFMEKNVEDGMSFMEKKKMMKMKCYLWGKKMLKMKCHLWKKIVLDEMSLMEKKDEMSFMEKKR